MKTVFKFIGSFISHIALIVICISLTLCLTWYTLPAFKTTFAGEWLLTILNDQEIFIITIALICSLILFTIFAHIFKVFKSSKVNNFYTHMITWLIAIVLAFESLFTFFVSNTLSTKQFEFNLLRKIAIGVGVLSMFLYGIFHNKLGKIIDRKIQAYDTAKELNANGRSSVIWVQILKTLDFIFPEFILLLVLCFAFNFEISLYFIFIIAAFTIPVIGNMICDKRVKKEAIRKEQEKIEAQIGATAEAVVDLITKTQGDNS